MAAAGEPPIVFAGAVRKRRVRLDYQTVARMADVHEEPVQGLPVAGIRHRRPGLGRRLRIALLQQFDRMQVGRAHERHIAVARRAVDGDAHLHQPLAGRVDVVDLIGEVAEITVLAVFLFVPVVGELDQRRAARLGQLLEQFLVFGRAQEHQREPALVIVDAAHFLQPQRILIELQRGIEIADAQHGVEITHVCWFPLRIGLGSGVQ
jgi:hypothetical protein